MFTIEYMEIDRQKEKRKKVRKRERKEKNPFKKILLMFRNVFFQSLGI